MSSKFITAAQAYETLQKLANIKEGDRVKILRTAKSDELGWTNVWAREMDAWVGKTARVVRIPENASAGISLTIEDPVEIECDCTWLFPFFVLEKLPPKFVPINVEGDTGAVFATIHKDIVHVHANIVSYSEARKLGREVAKVAERSRKR